MKRLDPNIRGYVGYWGSGKTLMMAAEARRREREDPRLLIGHNFGFKARNGVELVTIKDVIDFCSVDVPGWRKLVCIDEIGSLARARSSNIFPPAADVVFGQGRKLRLSILWTTQHWKLLDVNVRRVTDLVSECKGYGFKLVSDRGELPRRYRPRFIRVRSFYSPDPERNTLPDRPDAVEWRRFCQETADSYDTMKLVQNAQFLMAQQAVAMEGSQLLEVIQAATQLPEPPRVKRSLLRR